MGMSLGEPHLADVSVLMYNTSVGMSLWEPHLVDVYSNSMGMCPHLVDGNVSNDSNSMGMCPHLVDVNEGWGPDVIE